MFARRPFQFLDRVVVGAKCDINMGHCVSRRVTAARSNCFAQHLPGFVGAIHFRKRNRMTEGGTTADELCLFVKCDRFVVPLRADGR